MHFVLMEFFKSLLKFCRAFVLFTNWPLLFLVFIQIWWLKVGYCVGTVSLIKRWITRVNNCLLSFIVYCKCDLLLNGLRFLFVHGCLCKIQCKYSRWSVQDSEKNPGSDDVNSSVYLGNFCLAAATWCFWFIHIHLTAMCLWADRFNKIKKKIPE